MITGSVHTIEFLEFFYWMKRLNYNGWLSVDQYPYREDSVRAMTQTMKWIMAFDSAAHKIEDVRAEKIFRDQDSVDSSALMQELIFGNR
jgi:xylose isomerase